MPCLSCLEKAYARYRAHGLDHEHARAMAKKLVKRVEKRKRKEKIRFFYRHINSFLWKWIFLCNWRASLFWSIKQKRICWIGKGFNPDYTQSCSGACALTPCPVIGSYCDRPRDCGALGTPCAMNTCGCKAPLPNSVQVSNSCICSGTSTNCSVCTANLCTAATFTCPCGGSCGYNCTPPYVWNGVSCQIPVVTGGYGNSYIGPLTILALIREWISEQRKKEKRKKAFMAVSA
jgi:hypothetical protein